MTAPLNLREYFASMGSPFTKEDAEVIGPHIETLAEEGDASERRLVDVATSSNSPLHRYFEWDDEVAADRFRLGQAGTMLRSIRVRVMEDGRPKVAPAYKIAKAAPKQTFGRGHNILHGESAAAVAKAKDAFDELTSWRARFSPYVQVWADFAQAFRGVANQVSEAEDVINTAALDDRTDTALTDLQACLAPLAAWREKHGATGEAWQGLTEQSGFIVEAIEEALTTYTKKQKAKERPCIRCSTVFLSGGPENRMCERCAALSAISTSRGS